MSSRSQLKKAQLSHNFDLLTKENQAIKLLMRYLCWKSFQASSLDEHAAEVVSYLTAMFDYIQSIEEVMCVSIPINVIHDNEFIYETIVYLGPMDQGVFHMLSREFMELPDGTDIYDTYNTVDSDK